MWKHIWLLSFPGTVQTIFDLKHKVYFSLHRRCVTCRVFAAFSGCTSDFWHLLFIIFHRFIEHFCLYMISFLTLFTLLHLCSLAYIVPCSIRPQLSKQHPCFHIPLWSCSCSPWARMNNLSSHSGHNPIPFTSIPPPSSPDASRLQTPKFLKSLHPLSYFKTLQKIYILNFCLSLT